MCMVSADLVDCQCSAPCVHSIRIMLTSATAALFLVYYIPLPCEDFSLLKHKVNVDLNDGSGNVTVSLHLKTP